MKKHISLLLAAAMLLSAIPAFGASALSATTAFGWNFTTNAELPKTTVVSWGDQRGGFLVFDIPDEVLAIKDKNILVTGVLSAEMTFNNGRRSGQAPVITIISADGEAISSADMSGGSTTSSALAAAWANGSVLGTFDTLNDDESAELDLTEIVKSGATKIGLYLTCRSEDGYADAGIVNLTSPVLTIEAAEITAEYALESLDLPYNLEDGYELPDSSYGFDISWSVGTTIEAGESSEYKTLTAYAEDKSKNFGALIMGKNDNFVAAYTESEVSALGKSMHLALKTADGWEELNFGCGVLYAEADQTNGAAGTTKILDKPYLYRKGNGKIGVAAKTMTLDGTEDSGLTLWETDDLVSYGEPESGTLDEYAPTTRISADGIDGEITSILPISDDEADYLSKKLGEVKNIGVEPVSVKMTVGEELALPGLTALYSDGSSEEIPVEWDESGVDTSKEGVYTVSGTAAVSEYSVPLVYGAADPDIYKYDGKYYFIATNETGGQVDLYIRCADTIEGLADAEAVKIFAHTSSGDNSGCNWAPELHELGGELYCLFASSTTGSWKNVQSRIMKCNGDPTDADAWEAPVRVTRADGSPLIEEGITLDMTCFEANGKSYYAWAQRPITSAGNGNSSIVIAQIDPADPTKIITEPVLLCDPDYGWDRSTATVDEGPYVLSHDGKLYMTYSGNGVNNTYCLGMLTADENGDLLAPKTWTRTNYPVLESAHVSGQLGPGHNSFAKDEYGRDIIALHMKPNGGTRSAVVRTVHYAFDGTPVLYMTPERYLKKEYRDVTATVVVADKDTDIDAFCAEQDLNAISFFKPEETTADLTLETAGSLSGEEILWQSSDEGVITNDGRVIRAEEDKTVTLTATIGEISREFTFTVLAREDDYAYLFAYFTGNSASQERLFYGVSRDGYNFKALNGGNSVFTSTLGTGCIRDPFIFKGEDGYYYIVATDMKSSLGWSSNYATVVYKTPDLINIVDEAWINYREFEGYESVTRAWAPQVIWCPEKNAYMVYLAIANPDDPYATVMYRHYATDLCDPSTYTVPELMLDEPSGTNAGAIDGDIVYDKFHDKYIMYYDGKRVAEASELSGEWTHAETVYSDGQLPMKTASGTSMSVEGSNIWKIIGRDKWVIAADGTSFNGGCYALVETEDFESYTQLWEKDGDYSFDFTPRHGYVIPISERELNNLFEKYGSVELQEPTYGTFAEIGDERAEFESPKEATAIVAGYSEDGKLVGVSSKKFEGRTTLPLPSGAVVKAFLWADDITPLAESAERKN